MNLIGKTYEKIFSEFEDQYNPDTPQGTGDVKYHLGATGDYETYNSKKIKVTVAPNPSHLEWVNPVVEGIERAKISHFSENKDFLEAYLDPINIANDSSDKEINALSRTAINQFENYVKLNRKVPPEILVTLNQISDLNKLADTMGAHLGNKLSEKQKLLETISIKERLNKIIEYMDDEIGVL